MPGPQTTASVSNVPLDTPPQGETLRDQAAALAAFSTLFSFFQPHHIQHQHSLVVAHMGWTGLSSMEIDFSQSAEVS